MLLKIAASKLYKRIAGIPNKYIRIYNKASLNTSDGTFKDFSRYAIPISPTIVTSMPPITAMTIDVCTAFFTVLLSL